MEATRWDQPVPREIKALFSSQRVVLRETVRAVTPFGGVAVFVAFLEKLNFAGKVREHMAFRFTSPNQIEPTVTLTAFLISVLVGARRFAHTNLLRGDRAPHALLGMARFPTDDTIRNLFRRFKMGDVHRLFDPLAEWMIERLPVRADGYTLDLDSTVFERYGEQEGSLKGHNPRKPGSPATGLCRWGGSMAGPATILCSPCSPRLTSCSTGGCAAATALPPVELWSFSKKLWRYGPSARRSALSVPILASSTTSCSAFWQERRLPYIVVARMTRFIQREAQRVDRWRALDENFSVGQFRLQLCGWQRARRFVVVRERERESRGAKGRKLIDVPGYTFRVFATTRSDAEEEEIWRHYNRRADMENRIAELKHDLAADRFCLKQFFATEAAFQTILLSFNLLAEFPRAAGLAGYHEPATLRTTVFTCGAILGRAGRRIVLHLSQSWGGLKTRNPLLNSILQ